MINMAYKIIKWDHVICVKCMYDHALVREEQKNCWSMKWPLCQENDKIKFTHSKLDQANDPQRFILNKIASGTYIEFIKEDLETVNHNINNYRDQVVFKDNQILEDQGKKRDFCSNWSKKYEFSNPPHTLKWCHRLCRNWIQIQYNKYDEGVEKVNIKWPIENIDQEYVKPAALLEENKEQDFDNFNAFLEILFPVDYDLCNQIFYNEDAMLDDDEEELLMREVMVQENLKDPSMNKTLSRMSMAGETARYRQTANREKFIEQLKYDCECPICMMCYRRENPPLIYQCKGHTYKICQDSMTIFIKMAEKKEENLTIDWPIWNNVLEFETYGKSVEEALKMFKVDNELLDKIDKYPELKQMIEDDYGY